MKSLTDLQLQIDSLTKSITALVTATKAALAAANLPVDPQDYQTHVDSLNTLQNQVDGATAQLTTAAAVLVTEVPVPLPVTTVGPTP